VPSLDVVFILIGMGELELYPEICTFCAEMLGLLKNTNYGRLTGQSAQSRIVWQDAEFALMPSLGPIVEDHMLVIPAYHTLSFANLSDHFLKVAQSLIANVNLFFTQQQRKTLVFEHGAVILTGSDYEKRVKRAMCGACTDHAHMHIVPGISAEAVISKIEQLHIHKSRVELNGLCELRQNVDAEAPYILIGGSDEKLWSLLSMEHVHTQFMRRLLASLVGLTEWDWREFPRIEMVQKTIHQTGPALRAWLESSS
jgi:diadenosine tetraphosphate (Ap4A) HIT family hydrolase